MSKRLIKITLTAILTVLLCSCGKDKADKIVNTYNWEEADVYEAEDGVLSGNCKVANTASGFGGTGYVEGFTDDGDSVTVTIETAEDGFYDLDFVSASSGGDYKENNVTVDGESVGVTSVQSSTFTDSILERIYLTAGTHEINISKYWGWIMLDEIKVKHSDDIDPSIYEVNRTLCNPNASEEAQRLYSYMCDMYGNHIISGQVSDGMYGLENTSIYNETGEYPAILGLDMMEYSPSRVAHGSVGNSVESAIGYWNQGGIVAYCWHWNAPEKYLSGVWYSGFYTEHTNIDLGKILGGHDDEGYELLTQDIAAIATQLKILQDAGVPILWRPLHEASGGWFGWGASGPDAYKQLYILLYDKLTNEYGLNNLIWVWNGQSADWYPGDEYVDIIGWDIYPGEHVYTAQTNTFLEAASISEDHKMIVLSENGCLFDPDLAFRDGATWGYFCTWCGEFVLKSDGHNVYGEKYTEKDILMKVYRDERVITRDDLPDLTTYPINK